MTNRKTLLLALLGTGALAACATPPQKDYRAEAISIMKRDFQTKGIATADRLDTDEVMKVCNETGNLPSDAEAKRLEKAQLATVKLPADGKFMGDFDSGEKVAQSGRGMTWADKPEEPVGGSCYNCHQIGPKEMSFGTIGPSLYQYGKKKGSTPEAQKFVYSKIYNSKAFNACSAMPRFGSTNALTEKQIKDLVALLLDPNSPVNK